MLTSCPKCNYTRQAADAAHTPAHTCPQCGVIYEKAKQLENNRQNQPTLKTTHVVLDYELASLTQRALGQLIDTLIAFFPIFIGALLHNGLLVVIGFIYLVFYYLFADGFKGGRSYGKKIVGICVVGKNSGEPCSYFQSFVRNFILYFCNIIDWIFIFGEKRERLGDKAANTIVIKGEGVRFISGKSKMPL